MWWGPSILIVSFCMWRGANNKAEQIKSNWKAFCTERRSTRLEKIWSSSSHWLELNFNGFCFLIVSLFIHMQSCSEFRCGVFNERRVCVFKDATYPFIFLSPFFYSSSSPLSIFARHYFSILLLPNHWVDIRMKHNFCFCIHTHLWTS